MNLTDRLPAYFLARALALSGTGLVVMGCAYVALYPALEASLFEGSAHLTLTLPALLFVPLFLSSFLYLMLIFPQRELKHFPRRVQHPLLLLLSALNYVSAIALIHAAYGPSLVAATNPYTNPFAVGFLLALPAGTLSGLPSRQALALLGGANLMAWLLLQPLLGTLFLLQMLSSQLLVYLLFNGLIHEFRQKTIANTQLAQLHTTQQLLESRAQQETREAIARDLHDELGHLSTAISHNLNQYCYLNQSQDPLLRNALALTQKMATQIRSLSHNWQAPVFDVKAALLELAHTIPRPSIEVDTEGFDGRCSAVSGETLFRVCQEIITNSIRHSNASQLQIMILKSPSRFSVSVEDNGSGQNGLQAGKGLQGIQARVSQLGGQVDMALTPEGFRAQLTIPCV
ncbi:sensor histidine kinase [Ketobacter sp.]|uniref:sensor histidine kinase n=1 Tax=Ketobacter sp. TaxID=2083498 RepID=UPI000F1EC544|nr:ATP-binding protein [Ketobacter sp.]RLT99378.1 MAG: hypothetical protein D9N14_08350 [Ketobacter sp.]